MNTPFYQLSIQQTLTELWSSTKWISQEQAEKKLNENGPNTISSTSKEARRKILMRQFSDLMIILLIISGLISFFLWEYQSAIVLAIIISLNATIGIIQEHKASKIIEKLQKLINPHSKVYRDGTIHEIKATQLVIGDIIQLEQGDAIPADARVIESQNISCNDFALTGESNPVRKFSDSIQQEVELGERHNMIFMGTTIATGSGRAVVVATGDNTILWGIAGLSQKTSSDLSPLQKELNNISLKLSIGTFIVWSILFLIALFIDLSVFEAFMFALGICIALVPQWLPAQISIALSLASNRLAKKNVVVKTLSSVESLGSTTIICTDKTGTLTKNEMTVQSLYLQSNKNSFSISWTGYQPVGSIYDQDGMQVNTERANNNKHIFLASILASSAYIWSPDTEHIWRHTIGDPTEWALITLASKAWFDQNITRKTHPEIRTFPFDSNRKMMSSIREIHGEYYLYVKWSPESILENCDISQTDKEKAVYYASEQSNKALRNIAFAYKKISKDQNKEEENDKTKQNSQTAENYESELIFLGIASMIDPPRDEVLEAMHAAQKAQIHVCIITGDNALTAKAIAQQVWLDDDNKGITLIHGTDLQRLSDEKIYQHIQNDHVIFSRTSPEDKLRIVKLLEKQWEVVSVTGDGINDAPALKKADIGVAMGITGTDVAKESASLILLKDNFSDLVEAIREWRIIYQNIKKTILASLTSNGGELRTVLLSLLGAGLRGRPIAITPILLLCIDLIGEMAPLTALTRDPWTKTLMTAAPRDPNNHIIQKKSIPDLIQAWLLMGVVAYTIFLIKIYLNGNRNNISNLSQNYYILCTTVTYLTLVFCQICNILSRRQPRQHIFNTYFWSNKKLIRSIILSIILMSILFYVPSIAQAVWAWAISLFDRTLALWGSLFYLAIREIQK